MTKKFGFTLAEVLITLGIIGVVAAMTIPNLIANTNGAKFRSQFKKTLSTLSQAGLMAQAQYDFDYAGTDTKCAATGADAEDPTATLTFCSLLNGTLTGQQYIGQGATDWAKVTRTGSGNTTTAYTVKIATMSLDGAAPTDYVGYRLADGSIVAFHKNAKNCELTLGTVVNGTILSEGALKECIGFIDVNGPTLPNKEVTCSETGKTTTLDPSSTCAVKNDAAHMTDIFPIVFHDSTVEPATNAAKYVLTTAK